MRRHEHNLAVITCHFNPCGFRAPVANWRRWRNHLPGDVHVLSVELSFDGRFNTDSQIRLHGDTNKNCLWQKECLLNVALKNLPPEFDRVAWIDADILFHGPGWVRQTHERLDRFPMAQLFRTVHMLNADGSVDETPTGVIYNKGGKRSKPGGAWAARREVLEGGFYDRLVIGAGDVAILHAAQGDFQSYFVNRQNAAMRRDWLTWSPGIYRRVRNQIGYVDCDVSHLYHGARQNRQYGTREAALLTHGYDPARHVRYNSDGVLEWTEAASAELRGRLRDYFANRKEDLAS